MALFVGVLLIIFLINSDTATLILSYFETFNLGYLKYQFMLVSLLMQKAMFKCFLRH